MLEFRNNNNGTGTLILAGVSEPYPDITYFLQTSLTGEWEELGTVDNPSPFTFSYSPGLYRAKAAFASEEVLSGYQTITDQDKVWSITPQLETGDAVVQAINNYDFGEEFTAIRSYLPAWEEKELNTLRVTVIAVPQIESNMLDKYKRIADQVIQIGLQKKILVPPNASPVVAMQKQTEAVDFYYGMFMKISKVLNDYRFMGPGWWVSNSLVPYDTDHLLNQNIYTGVLSVTYRMEQDV